MSDETRDAKRRRRVRIAVLGAAGVFLVLWVGVGPRAPTMPVRLVRNEDGRFVQEGNANGGSRLCIAAQLGVTRTSTGLELGRVDGCGDNAALACRHIVVESLSEHALPRLVGANLTEHLKQLSCVERIDYYPFEHTLREGTLAPDLVVAIDLASIDEFNVPFRHRLDARIIVTAGPTLTRGPTVYAGALDPPSIGFRWRGEICRESVLTGVQSAGARYKRAAVEVAGEIGKGILEAVAELREKGGLLPKLPDVLYPPHRKPPELPFLSSYNTQCIASYRGLMVHSDTLWRMVASKESNALLEEVQESTQRAGWRTLSISSHLRMTKGAAVLTVYPRDAPLPYLPSCWAGGHKPMVRTFFAHCYERMAPEEAARAVECTLTETTPPETIVLFANHWTLEQRERAVTILEASKSRSARVWMEVANQRYHLKQKALARAAVLRAAALARVADSPSIRSRLGSLAESLGDKELPDREPDPAVLRAAGFVELKFHIPAMETVLRLDELALFFSRNSQGGVTTVAVRPVRETTPDGQVSHHMKYVWSTRLCRSTGTAGPTGQHARTGWCADMKGVCSAHFFMSKQAGVDEFLLRTLITPVARTD